MPLQATSGGASYDAFGGGAAAVPTYIEDVFSTWLYTGTGSAQTITNGIDLAGKGGMVWIKSRSNAYNHWVVDSARGTGNDKPRLQTNTTAAQSLLASTAFGATGFTVYGDSDYNGNGATFASWTFRKQPKFFDVVTWTGDSSVSGRQIPHNLGSVPGCIIVKRTNAANNWFVYHRSLGATQVMYLEQTSTASTYSGAWFNTTPTATAFTVGPDGGTNATGGQYVAYLFAHDAGGFGLTGTDNVITCGSFTTDGSGNATVSLGYEPQWVLLKSSSSVSDWTVVDNMRGWVANGGYADLNPNLATAEDDFLVETFLPLNATGFRAQFTSGNASKTYIYVAIRRGPMKTPTTGANVFQPYNAPDNSVQSVGFPTDMYLDNRKAGGSYNTLTGSRLIGTTLTLSTASAAAQTTSFGPSGGFDSNTAFAPSMIGEGTVWYSFRRAPGFFDVVCYTGTGGLGTVTHNLGVVPELMIVKSRSNALDWIVYSQPTGNNWILKLNSSGIGFSTDYWQDTTPTATSVFLSGVPDNEVYGNGITYVMYLFASCPGVSKVGSFTGTGATQVINCGFTGGARFVLIKRTDSAGDWYVWDSARGIVAGNDPYLLLNSTAAEVTNTDWVDTASTGFELSNAAGNNANINGASYIFLAIA